VLTFLKYVCEIPFAPAPVDRAGLVASRADVIVIPKASRPDHIRENRAALDIQLIRRDLDELDHAFPPPSQKIPLETL
jgi:hypothetical protein